MKRTNFTLACKPFCPATRSIKYNVSIEMELPVPPQQEDTTQMSGSTVSPEFLANSANAFMLRSIALKKSLLCWTRAVRPTILSAWAPSDRG